MQAAKKAISVMDGIDFARIHVPRSAKMPQHDAATFREPFNHASPYFRRKTATVRIPSGHRLPIYPPSISVLLVNPHAPEDPLADVAISYTQVLTGHHTPAFCSFMLPP
jgi:hypothetical protein